VDRADLLSEVLLSSERLYYGASRDGFGKVMDLWRSMSCTIGSEVTVSSFGRSISGLAIGLSDDGSLLVQTGGVVERVFAGDVNIAPGRDR